MIEVDVGGTIVEFPDETPPDVMRSALQKRFPSAPPEPPKVSSAALEPSPDAPLPEGWQGPQEPEMGAGPAFGIGTGQGATMQFGDELIGLGQAGTAGMGNVPRAALTATGLAPVVGAARLAKEYFTGPGEAGAAYESGQNQWRGLVERAERQSPYWTGAGQFTGAVAAPVGAARLQGVAMGIRMLRGMLTGATVGGVSGVGQGTTPEERAIGGATGAAFGAGIGTVAPPIISGATWLGGKIAEPIASRVRGVFRPTAETERRVAEARATDVAVDPTAKTRLTEEQFAAAQAEGVPVKVMDLGGEETQALARWAANFSPAARSVLKQTISERNEGVSPRMSDWASGLFHFPTEATRNRVISEVAEKVYEPKYAQAYRDAKDIRLWGTLPGGAKAWEGLPTRSPAVREAGATLEQIAQAPEVQAAIRVATPQLRNWAVRDGLKPPVGAFTIENGVTRLTQSKSGQSFNIPTLQYWDYIKRALDKSNDPNAKEFARIIRETIDTVVPAYKAAREAAQPTKFFEGAPNAFEAGGNFINQGKQYGPEAQRQLAKMTQAERELFSDGYVAELIKKIDQPNGGRALLNLIHNSANARREIETAIGPQRWRELEARKHVEYVMRAVSDAVKGNSTTARQIIEYGLTGVGGGYGIYTGDPHAIGAAALIGGRRAVNARMARHIAELLVKNDPEATKRGVSLLARSERMMERLRNFGEPLGTKGLPPQLPNLTGMQGSVRVGAEQEQ